MDSKGKRKNTSELKSPNRKRGVDEEEISKTNNNTDDSNVIDGLEFEDPFGDEFEDDEVDPNDDGYETVSDDEEEDGGGKMAVDNTQTTTTNTTTNKSSNDNKQKQAWRPGVDAIEEDEELEYDPSAYIMYHSIQTEWPCLSFDFIRDEYGDNRQRVSLCTFKVFYIHFLIAFILWYSSLYLCSW